MMANLIINEKSVDDIWREIHGLAGQKPFRVWLSETERTMRYAAVSVGTPPSVPTRVVFSGPPGCGKTTAAHLAGRMLHALGCIGDKVIGPVSVSELKLSYLMKSTDQFTELLESAEGGTLIIESSPVFDEHDHMRCEIMNFLLKLLSDERYASTLVIFSKLPEQFDNFLEFNPGYRETLTRIEFPPLSPEDCAGMFAGFLAKQNCLIDEGGLQRIKEIVQREQDCKGDRFANAFWVQRLARCAIENARQRIGEEGETAIIVSFEDLGPEAMEESAAVSSLTLNWAP